jgi:hypothetical protein
MMRTWHRQGFAFLGVQAAAALSSTDCVDEATHMCTLSISQPQPEVETMRSSCSVNSACGEVKHGCFIRVELPQDALHNLCA